MNEWTTTNDPAASNPDLKFAEIAKMLGEQWKSMDPTTRATYEKMAEADKERYQAGGRAPPLIVIVLISLFHPHD